MEAYMDLTLEQFVATMPQTGEVIAFYRAMPPAFGESAVGVNLSNSSWFCTGGESFRGREPSGKYYVGSKGVGRYLTDAEIMSNDGAVEVAPWFAFMGLSPAAHAAVTVDLGGDGVVVVETKFPLNDAALVGKRQKDGQEWPIVVSRTRFGADGRAIDQIVERKGEPPTTRTYSWEKHAASPLPLQIRDLAGTELVEAKQPEPGAFTMANVQKLAAEIRHRVETTHAQASAKSADPAGKVVPATKSSSAIALATPSWTQYSWPVVTAGIVLIIVAVVITVRRRL